MLALTHMRHDVIEIKRMQHDLMAEMGNMKEATLRDDAVIRITVRQAVFFFLEAPGSHQEACETKICIPHSMSQLTVKSRKKILN